MAYESSNFFSFAKMKIKIYTVKQPLSTEWIKKYDTH